KSHRILTGRAAGASRSTSPFHWRFMMATYRNMLTAAVAVAFAGTAHATTIFQDDFESHDIGDQITSQIPDVGEWGSTVAITPAQHTVQANPLGAGQALRGIRFGNGGS